MGLGRKQVPGCTCRICYGGGTGLGRKQIPCCTCRICHGRLLGLTGVSSIPGCYLS